jgi:hypothetical protein
MADYSIEVSIPNRGPKGDNGGIPEAPEDGLHYARKDTAWAETIGLENDGSIAAVVQVRQGTAAQLAEIVLNDGEIAVELEGGTPKQLRVGDGTTAGGIAPSVTGWNLIEGTSDDDQSLTDNATGQGITLFQNAVALENQEFYEFFGLAKFLVVGSGGAKINHNGFLENAFIKLGADSDWPGAPSLIDAIPVVFSDAEDFGFIYFQGIVKASTAPIPDLGLGFAQASATDQGTVSFLGEGSYLAYRKLL